VKTRSVKIAAVLVAVAVIPFLYALVTTLRFAESDKICQGVTVSRIKIGGLTRNQASGMLQTWASERSHKNITLIALDHRWSGTPAAFGARLDWKSAIGKAFAVGREGTMLDRVTAVFTQGGKGKQIEMPLLIDEKRIYKALKKVSRAVNVPHKDARVHIIDSQIQIEQDSCGVKLDKDAAVKAIRDGFDAGTRVIQLPVITDVPDVRAQDVKGIDSIISSFTTSFNPGKHERTHNLSLASHAIDGTVLMPGQVFSYNDTVGPRLVSRGYQTAQIYVKGKLEDGLGGGICQVSTTLYNSVLLAGLRVKERSPHAQVVPYVPPGRDATVAYGHRDFRFINSNSTPICVVSKIRGNRLTVQLYGSGRDRKDIKLFTGPVKRTPYGSKTIIDNSLPAGKKRLVEKGVTGIKVTLYRTYKTAEGASATEEVSHSRYPAQKAVYAVGGTLRKAKTPSKRPVVAESTRAGGA